MVARVIITSILPLRKAFRTCRLFSRGDCASCTDMWKSLFAGSLLAATAWSQNSPQVELANLREDVRGLTQKMGEMSLRLEQLERENAELRQSLSGVSRTHATLAQLNDA